MPAQTHSDQQLGNFRGTIQAKNTDSADRILEVWFQANILRVIFQTQLQVTTGFTGEGSRCPSWTW